MRPVDAMTKRGVPALGRLLRRRLEARTPAVSWRAVARGAADHYGRLAAGLPRERTVGAAMMVRLAAIMAAYHRALLDAGLAEDESTALVGELFWTVYRALSQGPRLYARLRSRDPLRQVEIAFRLTLIFPQAPPGYDIRVRESGGEVFAFDIHRCPVADYLGPLGLLEFCRGAICSSDFALADWWGLHLERPHTLAGGADHCDFRFTKPPHA